VEVTGGRGGGEGLGGSFTTGQDNRRKSAASNVSRSAMTRPRGSPSPGSAARTGTIAAHPALIRRSDARTAKHHARGGRATTPFRRRAKRARNSSSDSVGRIFRHCRMSSPSSLSM
jgi:hypothetical protein